MNAGGLMHYRPIGVADDICALCLSHVLCFVFEDNEGYSRERLCLECLTEARKMLKREMRRRGSTYKKQREI